MAHDSGDFPIRAGTIAMHGAASDIGGFMHVELACRGLPQLQFHGGRRT